jgi:hypothetical protein
MRIFILQYADADDTILFMEHDIVKAINMKLVLYIFLTTFGTKYKFS